MVDGGRWMVEGGRWMVEGGWWMVDNTWKNTNQTHYCSSGSICELIFGADTKPISVFMMFLENPKVNMAWDSILYSSFPIRFKLLLNL